jgi:RNA polymerase-binding transcription factor DksA
MDTKNYEEKLLKEKAELEKQMTSVPEVTEMGSDVEGEAFEEEADEAEEFVTNAGIKETFKDRLVDINSALAKIQAGIYGKCEKCQSAIDTEILDVNPEARCCQNCK